MEILNSLKRILLFILTPLTCIIRFIVRRPRELKKDDIVLVTGAAHGLGREMCLEVVRLGATVVCWDINESGNKETAKLASRYTRRKGAIHAYRCDVSNREEVLSVAEKVKKEVGNVTMLINNAGKMTGGLLETFKTEDIVSSVNVNFLSHFWTIEAFLPHMKSINKGQIVCVSSASVLMDGEFMVLYASTKYAITGLMRSLAEELAVMGYDKVKVTIAYPTFTYTSTAMEPFKKKGTIYLDPSRVAKDIITGALQEKAEFSVWGWLMPYSNILRCLPLCVRRASKTLFIRSWSSVMKELYALEPCRA